MAGTNLESDARITFPQCKQKVNTVLSVFVRACVLVNVPLPQKQKKHETHKRSILLLITYFLIFLFLRVHKRLVFFFSPACFKVACRKGYFLSCSEFPGIGWDLFN